MTLNTFKAGQKAIIRSIQETDPIAHRLMEMGLTEGCRVEVIRMAPFGDPMEIKLYGYHLSLRKAEAALIEVEECP